MRIVIIIKNNKCECDTLLKRWKGREWISGYQRGGNANWGGTKLLLAVNDVCLPWEEGYHQILFLFLNVSPFQFQFPLQFQFSVLCLFAFLPFAFTVVFLKFEWGMGMGFGSSSAITFSPDWDRNRIRLGLARRIIHSRITTYCESVLYSL